MKLLHTSDWHVGKTIRGHDRDDEHRAVLAEIAGIAGREQVDLVLVAGDLFDSASPTATSEQIVYEALLGLAEVAPVVVVAGNHDHARRLAAVRPLLALGRVTVATEPTSPADGGVLHLTTGDGTPVQVALLPFVSQRGIVRADALMSEPGFRHAQTYADRLRVVIGALAGGFSGGTVNLILAHLFVAGAATGGGERAAHLVEEYAVSAGDLPATATYVALGHLHRPQQIAGATAIHYCGSPLQLDFGEQEQAKQVNIVEAEPGLPAKVQAVPLTSGRALRTLTGTVAQLASIASDGGAEDAWLRAWIAEPSRPGLADEVRAVLGDGVVEVRIDRQHDQANQHHQRRTRRDGRTPNELFASYLSERGVVDPRLQQAFDQLHDELLDEVRGGATSIGNNGGNGETTTSESRASESRAREAVE